MVSLYLEEQDAQVSWHTFLTCTWLAQCPDEIPILLRLDLLGVFYCVLLLRSFSSVTQLCPTLCEPTDCNTPGFPVYHQFLELAHTHVHWVSDAIQPSHPLSSPSLSVFSSPASGSFPMSQFFTSGGKSIGGSASASVFPMNIQDWFPLGWTGWISLQSKGLSRVSSNTTVQKSNSHIHTWLLEKP